MKWVFLAALVFGVGLVATQDDDGLDLDLPDVDSQLNIPGLEHLPFNKSALPKPEEVERLLRLRCDKNGGGEAAYNRAKDARENAEKCLKGLIDYKNITEEMEAAKPTGNLDEVFRKYCAKRNTFKDCVMEFVNATTDCLSEAERGSKALIQNVTDQFLGFVCFKEGDRIALFIAEAGPECITDQKEAIFHCINATFGKRFPNSSPNVLDLPQLIIGAEECKDVCALQRCVVKELEKCKEPTPANIVQSMFDYILKVTPCKICKAERLQAATADSSRTASNYLSLVLSTLFVFVTLH
ncbi:hypothetical protein ONE63_008232 [Megalurothrips usitatus]|uniref:27 kDa hemolymph protein-like n=1 Tax=Megalurothrips usitatus TaxID=439358 RepID=A0AAV7XLH6_9NEOP|nr:hypothetical protein ONE63_008232 [Megalurothrips usitatus]